MRGKDLIAATLFGGAGGSSGGGGGGLKISHGTVTPLDVVGKVEHGLGVTPSHFMWFVTEAPSSRDNSTSGNKMGTEKFLHLTNNSSTCQRLAALLTPEYMASVMFDGSSDWGFYTYLDREASVSNNNPRVRFDEENVYLSIIDSSNGGKMSSLMPHSVDGLITVEWFAIGGA